MNENAQQDSFKKQLSSQPDWLHCYWGKTNRARGYNLTLDDSGRGVWVNQETPEDRYPLAYHLLPYHNLDVAAAAWVLLDSNPLLAERLAAALSVPDAKVKPFICALLAIHDIGKYSERFQRQSYVQHDEEWIRPAQFVSLRDCSSAGEYLIAHDTLGYLLLHHGWHDEATWRDALIEQLGLPEQDHEGIEMVPDDWWDYLDPILQAITGHHGSPPQRTSDHATRHFDEQARDDALGYATAVIDFFDRQAGGFSPLFRDWKHDEAVGRAKQATWLLAGLAILADWIGSNAGTDTGNHYFAFKEEAVPIEAYWPIALEQAKAAVAQTGVAPAKLASSVDLGSLFPRLAGYEPTPLQRYALRVNVASEPQLFILEDATGSGKTEAAALLSHRILCAGGGQGLYFGLPTMATANAMFGRFLDGAADAPYRKLFSNPERVSVVLAHSKREMQEQFRTIQDVRLVEEDQEAYAGTRENRHRAFEPDETGAAQCARWIADRRKKALLAHVGIGTVDQALMGVLPSKHQSLRLLGLGTKVLIVDEVHAYDEYVSGLLRTLIAFQAALGGSTILLSATLTHTLRQQFVDAYRDGLGLDHVHVEKDAFPLTTRVTSSGVNEEPVEPRSGSPRSTTVAFCHSTAEVRKLLVEAADDGRCACWIRNTVDDAITAYDDLANATEDNPDIEVKLFHARFALQDRLETEEWVLEHFGEESTSEQRQGKILIATQVVEQSLDLDFDVLVSDLAPVDLLIQRVGRQHRHTRDAQGDRAQEEGRQPPVFHVLTPPFDADPTSIVDELASSKEKKAFRKLSSDSEKDIFSWKLVYVKRLFDKARFVYPHLGIQWRTARVLDELGRIAIPEEARLLLETVYAPDEPTAEDLSERWAGAPEAWAIPALLQQESNEAYNEMKQAAAEAAHNALSWRHGYGGLVAGAAHWFDDKHTPTRLGEPTLTVRLARHVGRGKSRRLIPWLCASEADYDNLLDAWRQARATGTHEEKTEARRALLDAWQQSELTVRERKLNEATGGKSMDALREAASDEMPDRCRWSLLVPVLNDGTVKAKPDKFTYTSEYGLRAKK